MTVPERPNVGGYLLVLTMYGRVAVVDILRPDDTKLDATVRAVPNSLHMLPSQLEDAALSLAEDYANRLGFGPADQWSWFGSKQVLPIEMKEVTTDEEEGRCSCGTSTGTGSGGQAEPQPEG